MSAPLLFTPIQLREIALKNRVVVAPMHQYAAVKGYPTDWHLMNYGRFAAGGAGLVIIESTKVDRRGCGTVGDTGLWNDDFIPHFRRIADFIRAHGSVPGIQLGHSGRKARRIWISAPGRSFTQCSDKFAMTRSKAPSRTSKSSRSIRTETPRGTSSAVRATRSGSGS